MAEVVTTRVGSSLEASVVVEGGTYLIAFGPSYGPSVVNPSLEAVKSMLRGEVPTSNPDTPTVMLLPLQANGKCGANCRECTFARSRAVGRGLARPTTPEVFNELINVGREIGDREGVLARGQKFRVNALLSGDPSYNKHFGDLVVTTGLNPNITASRWSTIGVRTVSNPLSAFTAAACDLRLRGSSHKARFQVSLHSTDPRKRIEHVSYYNEGHLLSLIPVAEISDAFSEIKSITGESSTLAFVLHGESEIDPRVLADNFSQDNTWISLRPVVITSEQSKTQPMLEIDVLNLYSTLREDGWNVVFMPPTIDKVELNNPIASNSQG